MTETGLLLFPWDLAAEGVDEVMRFAADSGIRTLYLAASYHAGRFLHPHGPRPRVYMPEDGVVYFHPRAERYGRIQPGVAAVAAESDWLAECGRRLASHGLRLAAWTVCLHNTRLGRLHPDAVVRNAFGDPYWYALCPSHPAVRQYVVALLEDHTRYPLDAILLEAFRYMDAVHGEHHERWGIPLPGLERSLLGLSFAPSDLAAAAQDGIDGQRVRRLVTDRLERFLAAYPDAPGGVRAESLSELEERETELRAYRECLVKTLDALLASAAAVVRRTPIRLIGQGVQEFNVTCSPDHPCLDVLLRGGLPPSGRPPGKRVYSLVRLGFGEVNGLGQLREQVAEARRDTEGVLLYNYGEAPAAVLRWLKPALGPTE